MSKYRRGLPQLGDRLFVTDDGLETTLVFHEGLGLPCFAAFDLLKDEDGIAVLRRYYRRYLETAREYGLGAVLEAPTWRANPDWGAKLRYDAVSLDDANRRAIGLMLARTADMRNIAFGTRVVAASFDERDQLWRVETADGQRIGTRCLIRAAGVLSVPQLPDIPGIDDFCGGLLHRARWPHEGVPLSGKRVGIVGTAATGVQVIQTIAGEVGSLTVFQRTPNWCVPQRNAPLTDEERRDIKRDYGRILESCRRSYAGFIHDFDRRSGLAVSAEERRAMYETLWQRPGFAFWLGNFSDLMMDPTVNRYACDFLRERIAERVRNPQTARRLTPVHPFGTKRVPLENGYYEAFNRPNVRLVDLRETPIQRITPSGVRTATAEFDLDVLIFATGFDAVTGALEQIRHIPGGSASKNIPEVAGRWLPEACRERREESSAQPRADASNSR